MNIFAVILPKHACWVFISITCFLLPSTVQGGLLQGDSDDGRIGKMLMNTILPGLSLIGKTIEDLLDGDDAVRTAGVVDNFSKWSLFFEKCSYEHGEANVPMQTVKPGFKEGFAAHKSIGVYGVYMKCTFVNNADGGAAERIHFMVDIPWDVSFTNNNRLAMAVCDNKRDSLSSCNSLSLSDMSSGTYDFLTRRTYTDSIANIAQCNSRLCLIGTMGTSHTPIVRIKVYPRSANDLSGTAAKALEKNGISATDYHQFVDSTIKYADKNPSQRLRVCVGYTLVATLFAVCVGAV